MARYAHSLLPVFLFLVLSVPAQANPIKVTFTVFPASGDPVNAGPSTGSFTFDSALIPPGGGQIQNTSGLPVTDIAFAWGHTVWTAANAGVGELLFDPSRQLVGFVLGGMPNGGAGLYGYIIRPASAVLDDFFVSDFLGVGGGAGIAYTNAGHAEALFGRLNSNSIPAPVPEPSTVALLTVGLGLLGRAGLRRKREARADGLS